MRNSYSLCSQLKRKSKHLSSTSHTDTSMTYCQSITQILRITGVRCIPLNLRSKTWKQHLLDLLLSFGWDGQLHTSFTTNVTISTSTSQTFPFLSSNIPSSPAYGIFISQLIPYARTCSSYEQNRSTEGCSKLKRSVDMTSSGKNGLNIRTNASPKWDRTRCPEE